MAITISATEAARSFSEVLSRVRYRGEEFLIEKGGQPVGRLSPVRVVARTARELTGVDVVPTKTRRQVPRRGRAREQTST